MCVKNGCLINKPTFHNDCNELLFMVIAKQTENENSNHVILNRIILCAGDKDILAIKA